MKAAEIERIKGVLMTYLHDDGPYYEPVIHAMVAMFGLKGENSRATWSENRGFHRNDHAENTWSKVFEDLAMILSPMQLEQLADRISQDFRGTCDLFLDLAKTQRFMAPEVGGEG